MIFMLLAALTLRRLVVLVVLAGIIYMGAMCATHGGSCQLPWQSSVDRSPDAHNQRMQDNADRFIIDKDGTIIGIEPAQ